MSRVYGVVAGNGGHPSLTSEPGTGTTFTAQLPAPVSSAGAQRA
ncbi:MAG: hypothetical protein WBQ18_20160 [Solirubrobacteraceae bacterium]